MPESKINRLGAWAEFQPVLSGPIVSKTAHFAMHRDESASRDSVYIGAVVPKRWAKRAVTRNSIRRQVLAVSVQFAERLPACAHVVRLRSSFERSRFVSADSQALRQAVRAELEQLFTRALSSPGQSIGPH